MKIESPAFEANHPIPAKYTCEGTNVSPPLKFSDIPEGAKVLAIIVEDPDAPVGTFDHWIVWNISSEIKELREGASVPSQGKNHYNTLDYKGPCPPPGKPHRYFFKLYALDTKLDIPEGSNKDALERAMEGHILGKAELIGTYQRNK